MATLESALETAVQTRAKFIEQYKALLAIPTISTLPENAADVQRGAQWLVERLRAIGMDHVEILPTPGHAALYAGTSVAADKPALLVYGHYDVQPADPLDEWTSPPFEPDIRGENLYARGAADMKGSLAAFLHAVECIGAEHLPCNLKFLLEGEEEIGSLHLPGLIEKHRHQLKADVVVNLDGGVHSPELPSISYALRGLAYFEIEVRGPRQDLHSGLFGGSIHNPVQALCELIAGMHDAEGRVTLPGFYDDVRPLDPEEREALARMPQTNDDWLAMCGAPKVWGEKGYTTVERVGARPTLDVNGIVGGFTGEGAKTVLPARAMAKISTRLVADQAPAKIRGQLLAYMRQNAPDSITWEVRELSHGPGAIMDRNSGYMKAAVRALGEAFGAEPLFKREGGSVPVVGMMQKQLGIDSIMLGFGLPDSNIHGPNEKQHLPTLFRGIDTYIRFLFYAGNK
jgi:acetylornithine deacetylase/succinyl-diaminopimelate desuccinylase-like protein